MFEDFEQYLIDNSYKPKSCSIKMMLGLSLTYREWKTNCVYTDHDYFHRVFLTSFNNIFSELEINNYETLLKQYMREKIVDTKHFVDLKIISVQQIHNG